MRIMKLELKHLAPYLPYKLQVYNSRTSAIRLMGTTISNTKEIAIHDIKPLEYKPILRQLSDFTNNEWMEVFNAGMDDSVRDIFKEYHDVAIYRCGGVVRLYDINGGYSLNLPNKTLISFCGSQFNAYGTRFNMIDAFNKIYEKHGDLSDLINEVLAIDLDTIS